MAKYLNSDGLAYFLSKLKPLINAKADKTHTHNYAGSTSPGGSANSVANSLSIQLMVEQLQHLMVVLLRVLISQHHRLVLHHLVIIMMLYQ